MSNTDGVRWQQRWDNFQKVYSLLRETIDISAERELSQLEKEGLIKRFEYTWELAWKTLKDWLFVQGYDEKTPRAVIRRGFEVDILSEEETVHFLEALDNRNLTNHTYDQKIAEEIVEAIQQRYALMLGRLLQVLEKKKND